MADEQQTQRKRKRSQHETLPDSSPKRPRHEALPDSSPKDSQQEGFPGSSSSSHAPGDVQLTQAAATEVGDAFLLEKLPKELRSAIYDTVFDNTLVHDERMVEIMKPEFVGLKSLLGVSRKIRHEVQEVLRERMERHAIFKATCYNYQEQLEAASKSHDLFRGKVPDTRHVRVLMVSIDGYSSPSDPTYMSVTWRKHSVGWNLRRTPKTIPGGRLSTPL